MQRRRFGASGGCTLEPDGDTLRTTIAPLEPGQGITIGGTIVTVDPDAPLPAFPALPERRADHHLAVGLILLGTGLLVAAVMFFVIRRIGRNEVAAGGAADAAYGAAGGSVRLVPDDRMDRLATTEFVPPTGVRPWQGNVLLREEIGTASVTAWFSDWVATEALVIDDDRGRPAAAPGTEVRDGGRPGEPGAARSRRRRRRDRARHVQPGVLVAVGRRSRTSRPRRSRRAGGGGACRPAAAPAPGRRAAVQIVAVIVVLALFAGGGILRSDLLGNAAVAVVACVVVVGGLAAGFYWFMLRSRSAVGSGLAIRTESFRRFLEASEGQHVDWAWQHGVLREYSAWAVALGAADAWGRALADSHVPPTELSVANPLIVASMARSFTTHDDGPVVVGFRRRGVLRRVLRWQRRRGRGRRQLRFVVNRGPVCQPLRPCRSRWRARPRW